MNTYPTRVAAETYLRQHGYAPDGPLWVFKSSPRGWYPLTVVAEIQATPKGFVIVAEAHTGVVIGPFT